MVRLQHSGTHFPLVMDNLHSFKKDGSLCDIDIVVGDNRIPAHKCVLAAGSDYFKSLFCGPMKTDDTVVNLSAVTDDFESVETVIEFLYTGNIDVDDDNLAIILKLASFLLIGVLRANCIHYMQLSVDLDNCLQYYLLATEFMIPDLQHTLSKTVASRFHDCLIFKDTSLNVSPSQMKFLMESCNVFEYCSVINIMSFVIDWVAEGKSAEHEQLGSQLLDMAKQKIDQSKYSLDIKQEFCGLKDKMQPEGNNEYKEIVTKVNDIIKDFSTAVEENIEKMTNVDSKDQVQVSDTEYVLIAFAPNKRLIYYVEGNVPSRSQYAIRNGQALFDICIYIPRKKMWYHLAEGYRESGFKWIARRDTIINERISTCLMDDTICFIAPDDDKLSLYDLNSLTWEDLELNNPAFEYTIEHGENYHYYFSSGGQLYLITPDFHDESSHDFFRCYNILPDNHWYPLFSIPVMSDGFEDFEQNQFSATVSKTSHEMILACITDKLHVYIVDMDKTGNGTSVQHLEMDVKTHSFNPLHILESEEFFTIVQSKDDKDENSFHCLCPYKRQTRELIPDTDTGFKEDKFYTKGGFSINDPPCRYLNVINDNKHIWMFEGNGRNGSSLKSVSFEGIDGLTVQRHTPPPFSCVCRMLVGEIKRECLTGLKPVTKYLHEEVKDYMPSEGECSPSDYST